MRERKSSHIERTGVSPVEKVIIIVDTKVGTPGSALNDTLHVVQHVNVRIPGQGFIFRPILDLCACNH